MVLGGESKTSFKKINVVECIRKGLLPADLLHEFWTVSYHLKKFHDFSKVMVMYCSVESKISMFYRLVELQSQEPYKYRPDQFIDHSGSSS